ncbi:MAG: SDR family oxidoreductase [Vicinamibacterales bacterium]
MVTAGADRATVSFVGNGMRILEPQSRTAQRARGHKSHRPQQFGQHSRQIRQSQGNGEAYAVPMTRVLILGAGGQIARWVIAGLADDTGVEMTLVLRHPRRLARTPANARVVHGDVLDRATLDQAVAEQHIVYANLTGDDIDDQARAVIGAMQTAGVKRLVFVTSLGIYDEVPGRFGRWNRQMIGDALKPFRRAADAIEASGLDYTILRPAWLQDEDEIDYETTDKGQPFKGTEVSRRSVADLVLTIVRAPTRHSRANLGVNKPGTDGDKPAFY